MGILELLTIIFVVCKLVGVIDWSWWLVLLPELIAIGIYLLMFLVGSTVTLVAYKKTKKWRF